MAEHVALACREILDMRVIGVGEDVKRQAFRCALEQGRDARHFARKNRVPSFQELGIGYPDAKHFAQAGKEFGVADLASFMPVIKVAARKPPNESGWLAAGVTGPAGDRLV